MTLFRRLFVIVPALSLVAAGAGAGVSERYFSAGWSRVESAPALPPVSAVPVEVFPADPADDDLGGYHSPTVHMYITRKAYDMYIARYNGSELSRYIGNYTDSGPDSNNTVVAGVHDEDQPFKNPFNEKLPMLHHFWDSRGGFYKGLASYDSALNRAYKFWTGGFGIEGHYDKNWSERGGSRRGTKGEGVIRLYQSGDKAKAYLYLGHTAHFLGDLTTPAHTLLWPHPGGTDAYEKHIASHYRRWSAIPPGPIESFDTLYQLFLRTAEVTNGFDAGRGPGDLRGKDGVRDMGRRRADGFSTAELNEVGDALMPLAIERTAALFVYFYKQVDKTPPRVTLLPLDRGPNIILSAFAEDGQSGVDKIGYRFEFATLADGSWTPWADISTGASGPKASFGPKPGGRYIFRVSATDAAGNIGVSESLAY